MAHRQDVLDGSWTSKTLVVAVRQDGILNLTKISCADLTLRQFLIILEWSKSGHIEVDYLTEIDEEGVVRKRKCHLNKWRNDTREFSPKTRKDWLEMMEIHNKFMSTDLIPPGHQVETDGPTIAIVIYY